MNKVVNTDGEGTKKKERHLSSYLSSYLSLLCVVHLCPPERLGGVARRGPMRSIIPSRRRSRPFPLLSAFLSLGPCHLSVAPPSSSARSLALVSLTLSACIVKERQSWRTARRTASTMDFKRLSLHQSRRHLRVVVLHHRHCQRHSLTPTHGESRAWKSRKEHKRKESTCRKFSERTGRRTHFPVRTSQPHSPR